MIVEVDEGRMNNCFNNFFFSLFGAAQSLSFGHVKCAGLNASGIPFSLFLFL
jgi:hypothetical protein